MSCFMETKNVNGLQYNAYLVCTVFIESKPVKDYLILYSMSVSEKNIFTLAGML